MITNLPDDHLAGNPAHANALPNPSVLSKPADQAKQDGAGSMNNLRPTAVCTAVGQ